MDEQCNDRSLSSKLFEEANRWIPGGVNSPVRAWKSVGGDPLFIARARGWEIVDADGRSYIDYVGSWGPMILGHAHPNVLRAIRDAAVEGQSFGAPTPREIDLARRIATALPSVDKVRLVSSGTEAAMTALRLARGVTGRSKILKFAGCYHGHSDSLLVKAGSGALTHGSPDSPGVSDSVAAETIVADFNDVDGVKEIFDARGGEIACVILEPVVGNMGVVPPGQGFLEAVAEMAKAAGSLLIFDEVMTGFRLAWGGYQTLTDIIPDLTCLGKVVGGGMPLAALGGKAEYMDALSPVGSVYQAGTLSGNPVAVAAGLVTLEELAGSTPDTPGLRNYERLENLGARLQRGLEEKIAEHGIHACVQRVGSMWTLFFGVSEVANLGDAQRADGEKFSRYFKAMIAAGVYLPPSPFEAAFLSLAHDENEIDRTIEAAGEALASL